MAVALNQDHGLRSGVGACMLLSEYLDSKNIQPLSKYIATALLITPLATTLIIINGVNSLNHLKNAIQAKKSGNHHEASRLIQVIKKNMAFIALDLAVVVMATLSWKTAAFGALLLAAYHATEHNKPGFPAAAYMRFCQLVGAQPPLAMPPPPYGQEAVY